MKSGGLFLHKLSFGNMLLELCVHVVFVNFENIEENLEFGFVKQISEKYKESVIQ